jgi:hypothetical protein
MTTIPPIVDQAEGIVRQLITQLSRVREGECLCCYVVRQLDVNPCDNTHRHSLRFRDATAPRATALRDRLSRVGACCCDCELFMNAYQPHPRLWTPEHEVEKDGITFEVDAQWPDPLPPCAGVRRGSVQPCSIWVRRRPGLFG